MENASVIVNGACKHSLSKVNDCAQMAAPTGLKVFLHSIHASLEFDLAVILKHLGMPIVTGNMSRTFDERPEVKGWSGIDFGEEVRGRVNTLTCIEDDFKDSQLILMMNPSDFHHRVNHFSKFRPVVCYVHGQWVDLQMQELAGYMNKQWETHKTLAKCNIWIVTYTRFEENFLRPLLCTELQDRVHHIRFGKRFEEYAPWSLTGSKPPHRQPYLYTTCNDIHRRGTSCNWAEYQIVVDGLPRVLSGRNTNEVGGKGLVPFAMMRNHMAECAGYFGVPCWPAPLVLNIVEAMCCGAPVAYYDNMRGIAEEGIFDGGVGCCSFRLDGIRSFLKRCLDEPNFRQDQSAASLARAKELFDFNKQVDKWKTVFSHVAEIL